MIIIIIIIYLWRRLQWRAVEAAGWVHEHHLRTASETAYFPAIHNLNKSFNKWVLSTTCRRFNAGVVRVG